jgi:hypothetical protein
MPGQAAVSSFQSTKFNAISGATSGMNVAVGNAVLVFVGHNLASIVSVKDNVGNQYQQIGGVASASGTYRVDVYLAAPVNGSNNLVVTVTMSVATAIVALTVLNISNVGSPILDTIGSGASATSSTIAASATANRALPQELAIMGAVYDTVTPRAVASNGDSVIVGQDATSIFSEVVLQQSVNAGPANLFASLGQSVGWGAIVLTFSSSSTSGGGGGGSGGGGAPPSPPPTPPPVGTTPGTGVNVSQSGKAAALVCVTRGMKNAKQIQKLNPILSNPLNSYLPVSVGFNAQFLIPQVEPAAGFWSVVPLNGPSNINTVNPMNGYGLALFLSNPTDSQPIPVSPFGVGVETSSTGAGISSNTIGSLFSGIIHIVQVTYKNSNSSFVTATADAQTVLTYLNSAIKQVQLLVAQYGPCGASVDSVIRNTTLTLAGSAANFNDAALCGNPNSSSPTSGLVDALASANGWTGGAPISHAFVILGAPGVTNVDCDPNNGMSNYHSISAVNYLPYCYIPCPTSGLTSSDTGDVYQIATSHAVAEMMVDPGTLIGNPECCDPCGPNFQPLYRSYFDQNNNYLGTQATFPPTALSYAYMINAICLPSYSGNNNNAVPAYACAYGPSSNAVYPEPQIPIIVPPGFPGVPFVPASGSFSMLFPGGVNTGQLVQAPSATSPGSLSVIQLPLSGFGS